ncbi:RNA methyltransferase, TrmH family, group 1 [Thermoplasmatales archaeon BRNA1]|nr:RNA methyltransferase, TrmH family, group 1 [Thermoplasmatales archaeon BRNA1]
MPDIRVVVVGPKFEGNVGAIARCCANFGVTELYLVNPCEIGETAMNRSKHGDYILQNAVICTTFEEAVKDCFLVVGTSGTVTKGDKNYTRIPVPIREFAEGCRGYSEKIALVFGREDIGLFQTELNRCDVLVTIPAHDDYPVMNLSHSVGVVLYEMFQAVNVPKHCDPADGAEKELMFQFFGDLLAAIGYPEPRREATSVMFRRMMGRAIPTKYEFHTIMGVFGDAAKLIEKSGVKWG